MGNVEEIVRPLEALARRCEEGNGADNALDVEIEIALFEPDQDWSSIRANSAGTKVICAAPDGSEKTFWAVDWTMDRRAAAASLRVRDHLLSSKEGE